jgi:hypothetical protein
MSPFRSVLARHVAKFCAIIAATAVVSSAQRPLLADLHRMLPRCPDGTTDIAAGDVDGDGDLDLLVGIDGTPSQNRLYLNDGASRFVEATATHLPVDNADTLAVALADLDRDGDLDAYCCNRSQDKLYVNDGNGVFALVTVPRVPANTSMTFAVAIGDVDRDGDPDLVLGVGGQNRLWINDGTATFVDETAVRLPAFSDQTRAVALVDVDLDGDLDLLSGNTYGQQNRLCTNDGVGVFADETPLRLPVDADSTDAIAVGDVDGDGDPDLLIGNAHFPGPVAQQNRLYLNDGRGRFSDGTGSGLPGLADVTRDVALFDVDGDGDLDAWFANQDRDRLLVNDGAGRLADAAGLPDDPDITLAIAPADTDADGDLDLVLTRSHGTSLLLNDGGGRFVDVTGAGLPRSTDSTLAIALADLDGDGDLDVMTGNRYGSTAATPARLCLNDGTGIFTDVSATHLPADSRRVLGIALGDLDGDGDLDALLVRSGQDLLFLNDGAAHFVNASAGRLPPAADESTDVALVDVDGDGDLDAVITNSPGQNRLLRNDGSGSFTDLSATHLPQLADRSGAVASADVDRDGDPDLLIANYAEQDRLLINDGTGVFTDETAARLPPDNDQTDSVSFGDVDGDGDLDLLLGTNLQDRLCLNDGTGHFVDATANLPSDGDDNASVDLFDVDGDGDLDAFIGNWLRQNRLYLNDGQGRFSWASDRISTLLVDDTGDVAIGDIDQDGDLDVVVVNLFEDLILTNLTRQLAWRATPRLGYELVLDVHGAPGMPFVVDAAPGLGRVPVPPFGLLLLDPATASPVANGVLDGQGHGAVRFPVPPDPALRGARVCWQAIVMGPLHLTNLELTVLEAL